MHDDSEQVATERAPARFSPVPPPCGPGAWVCSAVALGSEATVREAPQGGPVSEASERGAEDDERTSPGRFLPWDELEPMLHDERDCAACPPDAPWCGDLRCPGMVLPEGDR